MYGLVSVRSELLSCLKGRPSETGSPIYREAAKNMDCWPQPAQKCNTIQYRARAENTIWDINRKYKHRQMLKILAAHMIGGGLRPPPCSDPSYGPLVLSAFASVCIFCVCAACRLFCVYAILFLRPLVLSASMSTARFSKGFWDLNYYRCYINCSSLTMVVLSWRSKSWEINRTDNQPKSTKIQRKPVNVYKTNGNLSLYL